MKVLITGSSKGIGQGIVKKFLACGHQVYGLDRLPASIQHPNYQHHICDIFRDQLPQLPPVEILVNNAGVQNSGEDIDINLKASIRVTECYGIQPEIKSLLFIASASASTGAEFPEYAASKGGLVAYMKSAALRVAAFGATANSLSPGGVLTELNQHIIEDPALWQAVMAETLLPKWATVEEIAEWAYFLTVCNRSMTAQDLLIDNGEAAKSNFIW